MDLVSLSIGLVVGFVFGGGAIIFYMRWKMAKQLNAMQQNMEGMFDMTEEMMEDVDAELVEEEEKEE
jgi:uncharacterized membrane-anchored protein YhcB (DUF1043 family)